MGREAQGPPHSRVDPAVDRRFDITLQDGPTLDIIVRGSETLSVS